jgi:hypothetical protein
MTQAIDFAMNFEESQQDDADKKLFVVFFREAVHNEFKSLEAGRPIFDDIDMIRIHTPGSRDTMVGHAHYGYQQRFPKQWAQYKNGMEQTVSGTPLNQVPWLTVGQVAELQVMNIKSVEQLAGMPDNVAQKFMNHQALKQQATAFLEAAKGAAPLLKMQAELAKRDETIAELQKAVRAMQDAKKA